MAELRAETGDQEVPPEQEAPGQEVPPERGASAEPVAVADTADDLLRDLTSGASGEPEVHDDAPRPPGMMALLPGAPDDRRACPGQAW